MLKRIGLALASFVLVLWAILAFKANSDRQAKIEHLGSYGPPAAFKIERDAFGVPSVYGATDAAVAYGLAYAHAEDDFETIQMRMAPIVGQLGAITGKEGAKIDYVNELLQTQKVAARKIGELSEEARAMAKAYAYGLNRYAADHPDEIIRHQLFPVTEQDVIAGFVLISPFFFGLDDIIGDLAEGNVPEEAPEIARGSNAFAIAPTKMADGSTVLISNSHQPWEGPLAWYEARIASGEGWSMAGPLFPGVPFILMGYNEHLSWTNTVNVPDLTDIYKLTLDDSGDRYLFDGEWRDLEKTSFWIKVKFGPFLVPVRQTVEHSVHGPVMRNDKGAYAFRYGGMGEVRHFEQYYRLNHAKSFDDWMDAMKMQAIPSTNFVYADREGNIAYLYNAAFPKRDPSVDWSGVLPGDDPALVWTEYEPFDAIPSYVNPESGYLVNANNTPFLATASDENLSEERFSKLVGIEDKVTNRIVRALTLLEKHEGPLTHADLHRIKYDTAYDPESPLGAKFVDLVSDENLSEYDEEAAALLRQFDYDLDGRGAADSLAALVIYDLYLGMRGWHAMPTHEEAITEAADHLRATFGRLDPPFENLSRLRRGEKDLPLTGGPDALKALYWGFDEDGRLYGLNGDSYIAYVRWDADGGLSAETIYPFGAAMGRPGSPHYADQAPLFAEGRMKPAPLPDWREAAALAGK
ncbi:penicillin acylase family protein [Parvularcula lutaonensis]|uniref:Penicillin acylase family protein n=1 Tax=Parvularcula lutaonensis TaxID=491923 RepID=A0ABV7MGA9_9PROT|nr:penicillin acylase family protein [Parvularcula lutaonensis]GGY55438.1 penicillin amidase [Parvularcula lutaonensis]